MVICHGHDWDQDAVVMREAIDISQMNTSPHQGQLCGYGVARPVNDHRAIHHAIV